MVGVFLQLLLALQKFQDDSALDVIEVGPARADAGRFGEDFHARNRVDLAPLDVGAFHKDVPKLEPERKTNASLAGPARRTDPSSDALKREI